MVRAEEVEMLVCGSPNIDMDELRKVTRYEGFSENDPLIRFVVWYIKLHVFDVNYTCTCRDFWSILKSLSPDLQKSFLRFTTGSDRIPVGGMSEMNLKISALNHNYEMWDSYFSSRRLSLFLFPGSRHHHRQTSYYYSSYPGYQYLIPVSINLSFLGTRIGWRWERN